MRKRFRIMLAILVVAAFGGVVWLVQRPSEPVYEGRRLSFWLTGYDQPEHDELTRTEADEAVRHLGTNAIPTLLRMLRAKDSALTRRVVQSVQKHHLLKVRHTPDWQQHKQAVSAFERLGAGAKEAVPALIE